MRKLSIILITSVISSTMAISSQAIANNNNNSKITKSHFTKQIQTIFPEEICRNMKSLDEHNHHFLKLSSRNELALCKKQVLPIINKKMQKYLPLLPSNIDKDVASKYSVKIYLDSKNQYIENHVKMPKKIFLHRYVENNLPEDICAMQDDIDKCHKEISAALPKCIEKIKTKIPDYLGDKEIKKYDPMINECIIHQYL